MWEPVRARFEAFSTPLEGRVEHMYADHLGNVTVGIGCLLGTADTAWSLRERGAPFVHKADQSVEASYAEVADEWQRVRDDPAMAAGGHLEAAPVTRLRLTDSGISALLVHDLDRFESTLRQVDEFAVLDDWPADAQLCLFSMAWAMGPAFAYGGKWPDFRGSCRRGDWLEAARHSVIANSWLGRRNAVNRGLLRNAAWAAANGNPPGSLFLGIPGRMPTLRRGAQDGSFAGQGYDTEEPVGTVQGFLSWLGFADLAGGTFDAATEAAVTAFQRDEAQLAAAGGGFDVDGVVGPRSWAALGYVVP